jgi:SAM-dependent methyltransferase
MVAQSGTSVAAERLDVCPSCGADGCAVCLSSPDRFHGRTKEYHLARCGACSLVWLQDPPSPAEMGQHYGELYDRAIARAGQDPALLLRRRDTVLQYKSGGNILDLGCSSGGFLATMQGGGWSRYGIEMSERVAREAESKAGAKVFVGDILDAPFAAESFDVITCFHVFEHVYQPKEVLEKVYRWLKPGGIFYAEMPNIDSFDGDLCGRYWHSLELPRHLYHYSPASLGHLVASTGLTEIRMETSKHTYIEYSLRYVIDDLCTKSGFPRPPAAAGNSTPFLFKAIRKACRLTVLAWIGRIAAACGRGPDLMGVFQK